MANNNVQSWACVVAALWLLGTLLIGGAARASSGTSVDLRILIDTSGSMHHTDPLNLRVPALRLVVGLLPQGARAGVYLFDERVVNVMPPAEITAAWQASALRAASRVNSRGQWTDIGLALEKVTADWQGPPGDTQRKILLMSDGMEDISPDQAVNAAAKAKLLSQTLPKVRATGASIYSIALSDEADQELLHKLATDTNGWYEHAGDAGLLQRLFLRLFSQAVQRDTLPLKDNRFVVDGTVHDLTMVVFHGTGDKPVGIVAPDGTRYSHETPPVQGRWATEQGYDMITIENPTPGSWQVQASTDPDNRVMVVTDISMEMDPIPTAGLVGEHLDLTARLREKGKVVTDHDFLGLLNFTVTRTTESADHDSRQLHDDGVTPDVTAGDGVFSTSLDDLLRPGNQELRVAIEGETFQRELHYSIHLYPTGVETSVQGGEGGGPRTIVARPVPEVVDPGSLAVTATLTDSTGSAQPLAFTRGADGVWSAPILATGGRCVVVFQARGRTPQGRPLSFLPPQLTFDASSGATVPVAAPAAPAPAAPHPPPSQPPVVAPPAASSVSWTTLGIVLVVLNALVVLGVWFGLRWRKQRNAAMFLDLVEKIEPPTFPA